MPDVLLILGAGQNQVSIIRKGQEAGFSVAAVDGSSTAPGLAIADMPFVADIRDATRLIPIAESLSPIAVYPAAEHAVEACAAVSSHLKLPGIPPEVAHRVRNKYAMREALEPTGKFNPRYVKVSTLNEAREAVHEIGFPLIVKPVDGNASRGVRKVDSAEDLIHAFDIASQMSGTGEVLIESFLSGIEYNVDGLMFEGEYYPGAVTGKVPSPPPYRFDEAIYIPGTDEHTEQLIFSKVAEALRCIGFVTGTSHVEVMLADGNVYIVEMAGRPGGGRIPSDLIPLSYGMDYLGDSIRVATGTRPVSRRAFRKASVLSWLKAPPGEVVNIYNVDNAYRIPGVIEVSLAAKVGSVIPQVVDCVTRDKIGYSIVVGETLEQAFECAEKVAATVQIETRPT